MFKTPSTTYNSPLLCLKQIIKKNPAVPVPGFSGMINPASVWWNIGQEINANIKSVNGL